MRPKPRSHRMDRLVRIYDQAILPVWSEPFGQLLLDGLIIPPKSQILDVTCATGYPSVAIIERMSQDSRLIAIDSASALLDAARRKVQSRNSRRTVFFRTESAVPRLSFADEVYDLVVCNLGLHEMPHMDSAIADFTRVLKIGGEVRCTLPLAGTFAELFAVFRQVLRDRGTQEACARLERHLARFPTTATCQDWMRAAGLEDARVLAESFSLQFASARELFRAPLIDFGYLGQWQRIPGPGQDMQDFFWRVIEAIDAQAGTKGFSITVQAGCLVGRRHAAAIPAISDVASADMDATPVASARSSDHDSAAGPDYRAASAGEQHTTQLDIADLEEIVWDVSVRDGAADVTGADVNEVMEIDALVDGRARPAHLSRPVGLTPTAVGEAGVEESEAGAVIALEASDSATSAPPGDAATAAETASTTGAAPADTPARPRSPSQADGK